MGVRSHSLEVVPIRAELVPMLRAHRGDAERQTFYVVFPIALRHLLRHLCSEAHSFKSMSPPPFL